MLPVPALAQPDDAGDGIRKYHADPDHPEADREGIGIYACADGTGYILCTDQLEGNGEYHVYRRGGTHGNPHDHSDPLKIVAGGADGTDGLYVTSAALGPLFPAGLMVAMNSGPRNFLVFRWEDAANASPIWRAPARMKTSGCQLPKQPRIPRIQRIAVNYLVKFVPIRGWFLRSSCVSEAVTRSRRRS